MFQGTNSLGNEYSSIRPGLGLVNLASKMCYPMHNNIGCIHFVVAYQYKFLFVISLLRHSIVGIKKSVMCCWNCRHVFLVLLRNRPIYMWPRPRRLGLGLGLYLVVLSSTSPSAFASAFWPRLTSLDIVYNWHAKLTGTGNRQK